MELRECQSISKSYRESPQHENKASRILCKEFNRNKSQESQKYVWKTCHPDTWQTHVAECEQRFQI